MDAWMSDWKDRWASERVNVDFSFSQVVLSKNTHSEQTQHWNTTTDTQSMNKWFTSCTKIHNFYVYYVFFIVFIPNVLYMSWRASVSEMLFLLFSIMYDV